MTGPPETLGVIGNIACVTSRYADGRQYSFVGGAALHVAAAAAKAGLRAAPISVIGDDLAFMLTDPRLRALDLSTTRLVGGKSCQFIIRYDDAGSVTAIDSEYGVSADLTSHALSNIGRYCRYHVCCRRPLDVVRVLRALAGSRFSVDFIVSSIREIVASVAAFLGAAETVFVNAAEFEVLRAAVDSADIAAVVVTDGPRPVRLFCYGAEVAAAEPPSTSAALEVTGAGDTLAGAFLAHRALGRPEGVALRLAVAAATTSVKTTGLAVRHNN